jgi:hypothetical protein
MDEFPLPFSVRTNEYFHFLPQIVASLFKLLSKSLSNTFLSAFPLSLVIDLQGVSVNNPHYSNGILGVQGQGKSKNNKKW